MPDAAAISGGPFFRQPAIAASTSIESSSEAHLRTTCTLGVRSAQCERCECARILINGHGCSFITHDPWQTISENNLEHEVCRYGRPPVIHETQPGSVPDNMTSVAAREGICQFPEDPGAAPSVHRKERRGY